MLIGAKQFHSKYKINKIVRTEFLLTNFKISVRAAPQHSRKHRGAAPYCSGSTTALQVHKVESLSCNNNSVAPKIRTLFRCSLGQNFGEEYILYFYEIATIGPIKRLRTNLFILIA
jgi:hypothetical protein